MKRDESKKNVQKVKLDANKQLKNLGNRIKQLRIAEGYSSSEIYAYEHDISRSQFGRYEKGLDLRFSSLVKVINTFGMTLEEFFSEGFE